VKKIHRRFRAIIDTSVDDLLEAVHVAGVQLAEMRFLSLQASRGHMETDVDAAVGGTRAMSSIGRSLG